MAKDTSNKKTQAATAATAAPAAAQGATTAQPPRPKEPPARPPADEPPTGGDPPKDGGPLTHGDGTPPGDEMPPVEVYPRRPFSKARKERYTPFLVVRYAPGDIGARPLPGGTVFWTSPDVWVVSSQGINQPVAGEPNAMFCRVNNRGRMDAGWVRVRYWWANPSLAITEANAHLVGTADAYVPSGQSVVVECKTPWVPIIENGGHECIFAEAFSPELDPLVSPLEPVTDRHVGQKNLHVIQVAIGAVFRFQVEGMNIAPAAQRVTFSARALTAAEVSANLLSPDIGLSARQVMAAPRPAPARLDVGETGMFPMGTQTTYARRLLAMQEQAAAAPQKDCQPVGAITATATLEAGEVRRVQLTGQVPKGARPGDAYGYELTQRLGNMVTGGYTVYVLAAEATQADCKPQDGLNLLR